MNKVGAKGACEQVIFAFRTAKLKENARVGKFSSKKTPFMPII